MWGLNIGETLAAIATLLAVVGLIFKAWNVVWTSEKREKKIYEEIEKLEKENNSEFEKLWNKIEKINDSIMEIYKNHDK